ncbi:tryptophan synthase subunit alpha [Streptomyces kurssanovii]|uniref:tryptophan synthase n=1 Tax=Streptomyces kurssanovii TaxID=67312 RepID=A0ABV3HTS4_9ACTN
MSDPRPTPATGPAAAAGPAPTPAVGTGNGPAPATAPAPGNGAAPGNATATATAAAPGNGAAPGNATATATAAAPGNGAAPASRPGGFFTHAAPGRPGLALFLNAGDPPLDRLPDLAALLDESDIDCLELAVPFPGSVTDGPVIRRSADRALAHGTDLAAVLAAVARVRPSLKRLRIALLADFSHTVKGTAPGDFAAAVRDAGCDGLLLHGVPPRLRAAHYDAAHDAGLPLVTTCYAVSRPDAVAEAAAQATAYLYLVAHYGRSGTAAALDHDRLARSVAALRATATAPVAVGFGVRTRADTLLLQDLGADAAVVGSVGVARIEQALTEGGDPVEEFGSFVRELRGP